MSRTQHFRAFLNDASFVLFIFAAAWNRPNPDEIDSARYADSE
jgi:hypothetical protein